MNSETKKVIYLETEPIFSIHIDFADGSNPVVYYNLNLARTMDVLKEWSENWILAPDKDCKLNDAVWMWHAWARNNTDMDLFDLTYSDEDKLDTDDDVEPILEDSLNKED